MKKETEDLMINVADSIRDAYPSVRKVEVKTHDKGNGIFEAKVEVFVKKRRLIAKKTSESFGKSLTSVKKAMQKQLSKTLSKNKRINKLSRSYFLAA